MRLDFVGIDPNTGSGQSPTIWVDLEDPADVDLVFQEGYSEPFAVV